jgi:hypothetical protein
MDVSALEIDLSKIIHRGSFAGLADDSPKPEPAKAPDYRVKLEPLTSAEGAQLFELQQARDAGQPFDQKLLETLTLRARIPVKGSLNNTELRELEALRQAKADNNAVFTSVNADRLYYLEAKANAPSQQQDGDRPQLPKDPDAAKRFFQQKALGLLLDAGIDLGPLSADEIASKIEASPTAKMHLKAVDPGLYSHVIHGEQQIDVLAERTIEQLEKGRLQWFGISDELRERVRNHSPEFAQLCIDAFRAEQTTIAEHNLARFRATRDLEAEFNKRFIKPCYPTALPSPESNAKYQKLLSDWAFYRDKFIEDGLAKLGLTHKI